MRDLKEEINKINKLGYSRKRLTCDSPQDVTVSINKKKHISFASNDYLGLANNLDIKKYNCPSWLKIEKRFPQKALECGDLAIVASGTSTVEAAIFGTPMLIVYKMNLLSWWLTKIFVNVNYAGMVNIIANKEIMPEYLQRKATIKSITNEALIIINSSERQLLMKSELFNVQKKLQGEGASLRAAEQILSMTRIQ